MDELTLLDDALPAASGPDPDVVAAGRAALLAETSRTPPAPRRVTTRRVVLTGGVAAALAVGVTVAQSVGGPSSPGVLPGAAVANAAELGSAAAAAAEREPWHTPRPDQWVYEHTRNADGGWDMNKPWTGMDTGDTNDAKNWFRVDGLGMAFLGTSGKLHTHISERSAGDSPDIALWSTRDFSWLPTEPGALLAELRTAYRIEAGGTEEAHVFSWINHLLSTPVPPKLRAALFRLLPTLGGVVLRKGVKDQIGRPGVAFEMNFGNESSQIILDTTSLHYFGYKTVVVHDYRRSADEGVFKAGTTVQSTALVTSRIVDHPGDTQ